MITITVTDGYKERIFRLFDWDLDAVIEELEFAFPELEG